MVPDQLPSYFPAPFGGHSPAVPDEPWTVVDLFSGAGGMSWGFKALPDYFRLVGAVDAEKAKPGRGKSGGSSPACNRTYAANIGIEPWNDDLGKADPDGLRARTGLAQGELDVLICCAPCTGFSQKMAVNHVVDDDRNSLVVRAAEFVRAFRPRVLVMENVKELTTGKNAHHFSSLKQRLSDLGYSVWHGVHDLSDFGLPQRRRRTLVVAVRDALAPPLVVEAPGRPTTVSDAIRNLPAVEQGVPHPGDSMHVCPSHTPVVSERIKAMPHNGGSWGDLVGFRDDLLIPSMIGKRSGSFPDVYGRLWWDRPAITITRECAHPGNGRYVHPEQDRMLTVREMALLQGFPPGYQFIGPMNARYNQIGDAVPPLVARVIAGHVATILDETGDRVQVELEVAGVAS